MDGGGVGEASARSPVSWLAGVDRLQPMSSSAAQIGVRPEFAARRRFCRLQLGLSRPFSGSFRTMLIGLVVGAGLALAAAFALRSPLLGAAIGLGVAAAMFAAAMIPFLEPRPAGCPRADQRSQPV